MTEAKTARRRIAPATLALIAAGIVALVAIIIAVTRSGDGASSATNQTAEAAAGQNGAQAATVEQMIANLRQRLSQDPDNHEGWFLLGLAYRDAGQYREGEQAFRRAMQLQPNNPDYLAGTGESLLLIGAEGATREAEPLFRRALAIKADHPQSLYYMATMKDLAGNHQGAVDDLIELLKKAQPGAAWEGGVRRTVEEIAQRNNINIAGRVPAPRASSPATAAIPGPTREQMEAARGIPPSEQDQMVKGMVDRLAARLQQNPRDERGWMMLMRSRLVQNDRNGAGEALRSALAAFSNDAAVQQRLRAAATELGIPQG
jgi:cytochrome c-type biogenesis protein CcmH